MISKCQDTICPALFGKWHRFYAVMIPLFETEWPFLWSTFSLFLCIPRTWKGSWLCRLNAGFNHFSSWSSCSCWSQSQNDRTLCTLLTNDYVRPILGWLVRFFAKFFRAKLSMNLMVDGLPLLWNAVEEEFRNLLLLSKFGQHQDYVKNTRLEYKKRYMIQRKIIERQGWQVWIECWNGWYSCLWMIGLFKHLTRGRCPSGLVSMQIQAALKVF